MVNFIFKWTGSDPVKTFSVLADQPYSLFFDSARPDHPLNRYSYICWDPFETIESKNGIVSIYNKEQKLSLRANPFQVVKDRLTVWSLDYPAHQKLPPFQGGAAGYFGYDLARNLENLPNISEDDPDMPDMMIGLYDKVLAYDHISGQAWLFIHARDKQEATARKNDFETLIRPDDNLPSYTPFSLDWKPSKNDRLYLSDISKVINYIYDGDIFQANISRRFTADLPESFSPYAHYCHLREINSAPFGSYMNFGTVQLSSCSPERFLQVQNRKVETRPIKGTLSSSQPVVDLISSEKDQAENAMIVDLLRNDLSKVCEENSVQVSQLCCAETYEGLHHLVSVVKGTLKADRTSIDLLEACFPGGSVTGAPKIRAMEIIDELEPGRRGPYCGCMGMIGYDDSMDTNIIIRTLIYKNGEVRLQTGGGIVSDSIPEKELDETLNKAAKLFESFEPAENLHAEDI